MRFLILFIGFFTLYFSNPIFIGSALACDTTGTIVCKKYYENGRRLSSESYRKGLRHGTWLYYETNGNLSRKMKYIKGKRVWESIFKDDKIVETIDKRGRKRLVKDCGCH